MVVARNGRSPIWLVSFDAISNSAVQARMINMSTSGGIAESRGIRFEQSS